MSEVSRTKTLSEIADLLDSLHKTPQYAAEGYPMVRVTDIKRGFLDLSGTRKVDHETFVEFTKKCKPRVGDILFSRVGSYGNSSFVNRSDSYCLGQNTVCISPKRQIVDPFYLYCCLNSDVVKQQIDSMVGGASQPTISLKNISSLLIPYCSIPTQHRISALFRAYDDLIENNTRRIKILEEMAQMIYREWFVDFRFPGHENVKMVESEVGQLPAGWTVKPLREVTSLISRGLSPRYDDTAAGLIINQKCIRDGRLNLQPARRQSKSVPEDKLVRPGDILINSTGVGTLGRVAQVLEPISNCTVDSHVSIVRPKVNAEFLGRVLLQLEAHFERLGAGSTGQTELTRERIGSTDVIVPPSDLQEQFSRIVAPMNGMTACCLTRNVNLRQTRDLLLPKLISGEVQVEEIDTHAVAQGV